MLAVRNYTASMVTYDLTIDGLHTYYVVAGGTPVLVHNVSCGRVGLGSTDLAQMAAEYRMGNDVSARANIAVFEYDAGGGDLQYMVDQNIPYGAHAEEVIDARLKAEGIDPASVKRIYSERIPCPPSDAGCRNMIGSNYGKATVSWSLTGTSEENCVDLLSFMNTLRGG